MKKEVQSDIEIKNQPTIVYLTPSDAMLFVEFQKRYAFIELMESVKAFDLRSGSVTVHFDSQGQIVSIEKREHYRM